MSEERTPRLWPAAWWALCGALSAFGTVALLTIGLPFLLAGSVMGFVGMLRPRLRNESAAFAMVGAAVVPAYLAWLNRGGPGEVCHNTATTTSCAEAWNPWVFVVFAVLLAAGGVVLFKLIGNVLRLPGARGGSPLASG